MIVERPPRKIRRRWRPYLRSIHAWSGLILSLFLAAMAASGSILLFRDDLKRTGLDGISVSPVRDPERLGAIVLAANREFGPDLRLLRFASAELPAHEALLTEGGAYLATDGRVLRRWKGDQPIDWLVEFHHRMFLGNLGRTLLGFVAISLALMIVTGVMLWWSVRGAWRPRAWPAANSRKALIAAHRDLGVVAAPILLLSSLTGIFVAWPTTLQPWFGFSRKADDIVVPSRSAIDWPVAIAEAQAAVPEAVVRSVVGPVDGKPALVRMRHREDWNPQGLSFVWLNEQGRIAKVADTRSDSTPARVYGMVFPLHSGQVPARGFRYILLFGGIGLLFVSLFGAEAYRRRLFG